MKKVDLWSQEAWEDILNRKRKYFEFLKLTGELNDERSDDDDGGQEDFEFKQEEEDEFPQEHDQYEGEHEEAHHQQGEYEQNFEVEDEQEENAHHDHEAENNNIENIHSQNQIEIEEPGEVEEEFQQGEPEGRESNQFSDKIETSERSESGVNLQE